MGKYSTLGQCLGKSRKRSMTISFSEVERILGFALPMSARKHRPWWANDETHVQAVDGWLSVGWKVDSVDLKTERVNLKKSMQQEHTRTASILQGKRHLRRSTPKAFEDFARVHMSSFLRKELRPRKKEGWPKLFDMVSEDHEVVGDAKYMSMVGGKRLPPAKFSIIAEHVWMLENVVATRKFLVFGNDKRVAEEWLKRYGKFVKSVQFYFLSEDGKLTELN